MPSTPIRIIIGIVIGAFIGAACWQAWLTSIPLGWLAIPAAAALIGIAAAFVKEDFWDKNAS
jgi:hypothetical protein